MSAYDSGTAPGLYIHIPFCRTKCPYCDFYSVTATGLVETFLAALSKEMGLYRGVYAKFDTIYLGGGTPSLLYPHQIEALIDRIRTCFALLPDPEVTLEMNPADWSRDDLRLAREAGVNRLSVGVQSFNDAELDFLGRRHTAAQAAATLENARNAGFDNISVDLMYSLPGQDWTDWQHSLERALEFSPPHLSCYELELKGGTPLGRRADRGEVMTPGEDSLRDFFIRTSEFLENSGYVHYEISNFAAGMDRASRHNQKYWDHTGYLGLGPSAHSFNGSRRWWNHASIQGYLEDIDAGKAPVAGSEVLSADQLRMEAVFLALRTHNGIDVEEMRMKYGYDLLKEKKNELNQLIRAGLAEISGGHIRLTRNGMAVADSLTLLYG